MNYQEFMPQVKAGSVHGAYLFEGPEENIEALRNGLANLKAIIEER